MSYTTMQPQSLRRKNCPLAPTFVPVERGQHAAVPANLEEDLLGDALRDGPLGHHDAHACLRGAEAAPCGPEDAAGSGHHLPAGGTLLGRRLLWAADAGHTMEGNRANIRAWRRHPLKGPAKGKVNMNSSRPSQSHLSATNCATTACDCIRRDGCCGNQGPHNA